MPAIATDFTHDLSHVPSLLHLALRDAARSRGDAVAYIDGERRFSFADMDALSARTACGLRALGLSRGDRIAVLSPNQVEWLQLFFSAAHIGVAVVALSPRYRDSEIAFMLADSQAKAVFTAREVDGFEFLPMFERIAPRLPELRHVIAFDSDAFAALAGSPQAIDAVGAFDAVDAGTAGVQPEDLAMVIYTSGTTGRPKGCALTHRSLLASAVAQARHTRTRAGDLVQLSNPFNHVGGITRLHWPRARRWSSPGAASTARSRWVR